MLKQKTHFGYEITNTQRSGIFNTKQDVMPLGFEIINIHPDYRLATWKAFRETNIPYLPVIEGYRFISKRQGCEPNNAGIIIHKSFVPTLKEFFPELDNA